MKIFNQERLQTISCDICKTIFVADPNLFEDTIEISNMLNIEYMFGYGSPLDGDSYTLDVCQNCVEKKLKNFMIKKLQ